MRHNKTKNAKKKKGIKAGNWKMEIPVFPNQNAESLLVQEISGTR